MTEGEASRAIRVHLEDLAETAAASAGSLASDAARYAAMVLAALGSGGRLFYAGNGGSAATAEHVATEYVVRLRRERRAVPALALTAGSAQLTAAANDYGYAKAFLRPLEAWARPGDLLVLHSTSGNSENLLEAARAAARLGVSTVALLGASGGALASLVDLPIRVPSSDTARIQEIHLALEHAVAEIVDASLARGEGEA